MLMVFLQQSLQVKIFILIIIVTKKDRDLLMLKRRLIDFFKALEVPLEIGTGKQLMSAQLQDIEMLQAIDSVSYTHLTLPTMLLV